MSDSDDFETLRVRVSSGTVRQTQQTQPGPNRLDGPNRTNRTDGPEGSQQHLLALARRPARPTSSQESIVNSQQPQVAHPQWVVHPQPTICGIPAGKIAAFMSLEEHVNQVSLDSSVTAMDQSTLMPIQYKKQKSRIYRGFIQEQNQGSIQGS
ncbi:hypothetical protein BASA81_018421 [Batrachochytrium salamandrivorans]|nr:hypothetical protein BASA81_018421 [Batrachochytrium salamandrivorans]